MAAAWLPHSPTMSSAGYELPSLALLVTLAQNFPSTSVPHAEPTSAFVAHFGPLLNDESHYLSWPQVDLAFQATFGRIELLNTLPLRSAAGCYGLELCIHALMRVDFSYDAEGPMAAEIWLASIARALVDIMNEVCDIGHWDYTGEFHSSCSYTPSESYYMGSYSEDPSEHSYPCPSTSTETSSLFTFRTASRGASQSATSLEEVSRKRSRRGTPPPNRPRAWSLMTISDLPRRVFPASVPILPILPRLYRAFPLPSALPLESPHRATLINAGLPLMECPEQASWNSSAAKDIFDLYTPRLVRGHKGQKEGLCPICVENVDRGGEGEEKWLNLRNSAYVYHMSLYHGISKQLSRPFSPPIEHRYQETNKSSKGYRPQMLEGRCHHCNKWIKLQSPKNNEVTVAEIFWWKHAKTCHGSRKIEGETGDIMADDYLQAVMASRG